MADDVIDLVYSDLTPQQRLMLNQIFKTHKISKTNRSSVTLRFQFTPSNSPVVANSSPQAEGDDFSEFLGHLGKLRFAKSHKRQDWPLDKLVKTIDSFLEDRKTVVSLQKLQGGKSLSIAQMLLNHFVDKCRLRSTLEYTTLDFVAALQHHRVQCMQVDTFARLLAGEFDATDLLFYKYIKTMTKSQRSQMTYGSCLSHSRRLFGAEQEQIHKALEFTLNSEIEAVGSQVDADVLVDTQFFVYLAVWVFHHQRKELGLVTEQQEDVSPIQGGQDDIDGYINSIRQYREATRALSTEQTPRNSVLPSEVHRKSLDDSQYSHHSAPDGLEHEIQTILLKACRRFVKDETHAKLLAREADALLQVVMMGDEEAWAASVGDASFPELLVKRDALVQEGLEDGEARKRIEEFCNQLAQITVGLISKE